MIKLKILRWKGNPGLFRWGLSVISLVAQMIKNLPAMLETQVWSLSWEDPLEKGMATHSSILARRIPWTKKPGGLQSLATVLEWLTHKTYTHTHTHTQCNFKCLLKRDTGGSQSERDVKMLPFLLWGSRKGPWAKGCGKPPEIGETSRWVLSWSFWRKYGPADTLSMVKGNPFQTLTSRSLWWICVVSTP